MTRHPKVAMTLLEASRSYPGMGSQLAIDIERGKSGVYAFLAGETPWNEALACLIAEAAERSGMAPELADIRELAEMWYRSRIAYLSTERAAARAAVAEITGKVPEL